MVGWGLLVLLSGCVRADLSKPDCACDTGVIPSERVPVWQGFSLRWRDISHRFAYLRAGIGFDPWAEGDADRFHAQLGTVGGDWSDGTMWRDFPAVDLGWTWVDLPGAEVYLGNTELRVRGRDHCKIYDADPSTPQAEPCEPGDPDTQQCDAIAAENALTAEVYGEEACQVTADRPQDGRVVAREVVYLDDVGLAPRAHWAVVLAGVCGDTDLPLDVDGDVQEEAGLRYDALRGWTFGGMGAGVGEVTYDPVERSVRFEVWSRFEPGRVRDAFRPDMTLAMNYAQIETHVRWMLVGLDAPLTRTVQPAGHCATFPRADRGFPVDTEHPRAITEAVVEGTPGVGEAVTA
ncbi:MAG: hypothetical protein KC656_24240, partial [Myxococcales bacterium]|nr:hypothetical protein [Myxococcales bacterium]